MMDRAGQPAGVAVGRVPGPSRWALLLAASAVVLLHAIWLIMALRPVSISRLPSRAIRQAPPQVAFLGPSEPVPGQLEADVRLIGSPVLFALPTGVGFSGPLLANPGVASPPRLLEDEPLPIRRPDRAFEASPYGASSRDLVALMDMPRPLPVPRPYAEADAPMPLSAPSTNRFMVYWQDRPERSLESIPVTDAAQWAGTLPWSMTLFVCFDPEGRIRQVMIEKPSPYADVTAAVLRIARGMVFGTPLPGDCGRLVVVYNPAVGAAE